MIGLCLQSNPGTFTKITQDKTLKQIYCLSCDVHVNKYSEVNGQGFNPRLHSASAGKGRGVNSYFT